MQADRMLIVLPGIGTLALSSEAFAAALTAGSYAIAAPAPQRNGVIRASSAKTSMPTQSNVTPGSIDPLRRYSVETALKFLGCGRPKLYEYIRYGRIKVIREGLKTRTLKDGRVIEVAGRTFIPGSEIARLSQV